MTKITFCFFLFLVSFFAFFSSGVFDSVDGLQYLAVARNIYYKGEPIAPLYEYNTRENLHLSSFVAANGKTYSMTGLGYSLELIPAVFVTDMVYRFYQVASTDHFPLKNDWMILLTAGFTNNIMAGFLGIFMFLYFVLLKVKIRDALILSFLSIVSTNLFVYSKHSFAHMSFIALEMLIFLLIKYYSLKRNPKVFIFTGISFGFLSIVYNQTFLLTVPAFLAYYIFLIRPGIKSYKKIALESAYFLLGLAPFILIYFWYENIRSLPERNYAGAEFFVNYAVHSIHFPIGVFAEGMQGQLFSPGRSIFVYSPVLLLIIFFWMKIKKTFYPEFLTFLILSVSYVLFYSAQYSIGAPDQGVVANWHGELSWGPRYLTPLIPLGMIVVGSIYQNFSKLQRYLFFYPLILIGIAVEILGVVLPYQLKLHDMEPKIFLNGTEYTSSLYSDFLPRYNPILNMAKKMNDLRKSFPKEIDHGEYNLKFIDGIDFAFPVGGERWRVVEGKGYLTFDNNKADPVREMDIELINHPIEESSESAKVNVYLNGQIIKDKTDLEVTKKTTLKLNLAEYLVKDKGNEILIDSKFDHPVDIKFDLNPDVTVGKKQILAITSFGINGKKQNMETIDVPSASPLGPAMTGIQYRNWGGENKDPWRVWDIHTQTFERLPDVWWIRNLFYWDIPKNIIIGLFVLNLATLVGSGFMLFKNLKIEKEK